MIKISITQTCDACGSERALKLPPRHGDGNHFISTHDYLSMQNSVGWRQLDGKCVCPKCINKLFNKR